MGNFKRNVFLIVLFVRLAVGAYTIIQWPSPRVFERISPQTSELVEPSFLIFHHTAISLEQSLDVFTNDLSKVSVHYMVDREGQVYQHVPENKLAKHCGDESFWRNVVGLNAHSIGIELVNLGFKEKPDQPMGTTVQGQSTEWYPYTDKQINAAIELGRDILQRNKHIKPLHVLGHGDISPCRKSDPGPLFPWKKFAENGIGVVAKDPTQYALPCLEKVYHDDRLRHAWFMKHVHYLGYRKPKVAKHVPCIVRSFQMHFRQDLIDGLVDKETADVLKALLCEYVFVNKDQPVQIDSCPACSLRAKY